MKTVADIREADLWPSAAAAYDAARAFILSPAGAAAGTVDIRPVPVAGRFALQVEASQRREAPRRVVGYLAQRDASD